MQPPAPLLVSVVVPVHDEQEHLGACLAALRRAADGVRSAAVRVVVVLDSCTDGSSGVAQAWAAAWPAVQIVEVDVRRAGLARRAGCEAAVAAARDVPVDRHWLAWTDADSTVTPGWLTGQLGHAAAGADLVAGTVLVDRWSLAALPGRARYDAAYQQHDGHDHAHGANLGVRASALRAAGGVADVVHGEDRVLVDAVRAAGLTVVASAHHPVTTSGRLVGRAEAGFAAHLRDLAGRAVEPA